ncbi:MAG: HAMP domain-containing protein [Acidimicrobiales bacterium]|nr:HAMP domain-containing protein [Acidimicrobiales bacterium]
MSLRLKIFCLFLVLTVACVAGMNWFVNARVETGFRAVEVELGHEQITRLREAVSAEQRTLARLTRIDAVWSEPYRLLQAGDAEAIAATYPPADLLNNYDISEIIVVDADGAFFAGGRTANTDRFDPATSSVAQNAPAFVGADDGSTCGLWQLDTASLFCTHPVLRTDGTGTPAGWLTFFQPVDDELLARLSAQLQLPLRLAGDVEDAPGGDVLAIDDTTMRLSAAFELQGGGAPLRLSADVPRPVTRQAAQTERDLLIAVLACVGLFATATAALAETLVLRRIVSVTRLATDVRRTGDLGLRAPTHGSDELAALTGSVNDMLTALEQQRADLLRASASRAAAEANLEEAREAVAASGLGVIRQLDLVAGGAHELRAGSETVRNSAHTASVLIADARSAVQRTEALVAELGASTETIQEVATVIASVAQKTNLLALNATIEAARAGDAGRGFAVVAGEVKELALKTSESTLSIEQDVDAMQAGMRAIEESIARIAALTDDLNHAAVDIADATARQGDVTDHVTGVLDSSRASILELLER